ncbi:MAG TPA: hypothetical protein VFF90_07710, partial [Saprospiraceae bacterium]|nr:hypothetical protein [Saprospiraceae bacterium]
MTPFISRRILVLLSFTYFGLSGWSQNLLPNPSFEVYTTCPTNYNTGEPLQCIPWTKATQGTADYFNVCAFGNNVGVPANYFGSQSP